MDRFKFRAWDDKNKKWLHADNGKLGCSLKGEVFLLGGWLSEVSLKELDNIVIEQCTGLKDKNGKLIYEGDIIKCNYGNCEVFWNNTRGMWYYDHRIDESSLSDNLESEMEITGNIHDKEKS